jgi:hypothetical protein
VKFLSPSVICGLPVPGRLAVAVLAEVVVVPVGVGVDAGVVLDPGAGSELQPSALADRTAATASAHSWRRRPVTG